MPDITKSKIFPKELQVKLTDPERLDFSDRLAREVQEQSRLESALSEVKKDYAAKIEATKASIGNISRIISNGYEYRPVSCFYQYDWINGQRYCVRSDTGEKIEQRAISMEERQQQLDLEKKQEEEKPKETVVRHEVVIHDNRDVVDAEIVGNEALPIESRPDHDEHCPECGNHVLDDKQVVCCGLPEGQKCECTVCAAVVVTPAPAGPHKAKKKEGRA